MQDRHRIECDHVTFTTSMPQHDSRPPIWLSVTLSVASVRKHALAVNMAATLSPDHRRRAVPVCEGQIIAAP